MCVTSNDYSIISATTEPPPITNLEIVEINENKIHLRWQNPRLPLNGKLQGYEVLLCPYKDSISLCDIIQVHLNETCSLWDDYMCKTINYTRYNIQVRSYYSRYY